MSMCRDASIDSRIFLPFLGAGEDPACIGMGQMQIAKAVGRPRFAIEMY
jgi:hypothetical protein